MNMWKLAWRNVWSKPWALLLSVILFALGIGLISFLFLLNEQMKEKFDNNLAGIDMVVGAKGSPLQLILSSMYHVDNPTGNISIKEAKPFLNPKHPLIKRSVPLSLGDNYQSYRIVGTNYSILELYGAEISKGELWKREMEATIGSDVAEQTGLRIGDSFSSSHGFNIDENLVHGDTGLKVVGILKESRTVLDQLILTNSSTVWAVHEHGEEHE